MTKVLSHGRGSDAGLAAAVAAAQQRIATAGPEFGTQAQLTTDLAQWMNCDLGRWMLVHGGWNGEWTRYCVGYPERVAAGEQEPVSGVERFFLTEAPAVVATQERAVIFTELLNRLLRPGATALSVPCGAMDELLACPAAERAAALVGVDLDPTSLDLAHRTAVANGLAAATVLALGDAWDMRSAEIVLGESDRYRRLFAEGVDVVTSNGLNIYVADDNDVIDLYASFRSALKEGGHLVVSALTPPEEWQSADIGIGVLRRARGLMLINDVMWSNLRPTQTTVQQLAVAGLEVTEIHRDRIGAFPTFLARAV